MDAFNRFVKNYQVNRTKIVASTSTPTGNATNVTKNATPANAESNVSYNYIISNHHISHFYNIPNSALKEFFRLYANIIIDRNEMLNRKKRKCVEILDDQEEDGAQEQESSSPILKSDVKSFQATRFFNVYQIKNKTQSPITIKLRTMRAPGIKLASIEETIVQYSKILEKHTSLQDPTENYCYVLTDYDHSSGPDRYTSKSQASTGAVSNVTIIFPKIVVTAVEQQIFYEKFAKKSKTFKCKDIINVTIAPNDNSFNIAPLVGTISIEHKPMNQIRLKYAYSIVNLLKKDGTCRETVASKWYDIDMIQMGSGDSNKDDASTAINQKIFSSDFFQQECYITNINNTAIKVPKCPVSETVKEIAKLRNKGTHIPQKTTNDITNDIVKEATELFKIISDNINELRHREDFQCIDYRLSRALLNISKPLFEQWCTLTKKNTEDNFSLMHYKSRYFISTIYFTVKNCFPEKFIEYKDEKVRLAIATSIVEPNNNTINKVIDECCKYEYLLCEKDFYHFNGVHWVIEGERPTNLYKMILSEVLDKYKIQRERLKQEAMQAENLKEFKYINCKDIVRNLQMDASLTTCMNFFKKLVATRNKSIFDEDIELYAYTDFVYDFKFYQATFGVPDDFVTFNCENEYVLTPEEEEEKETILLEIGAYMKKLMPNDEKRVFMEHVISTSFTGHIDYCKVFIWSNIYGGGGKSSFADFVGMILGRKYAQTIDTKLFSASDKTSSGAASPALADKCGCRFARANELPPNVILNTTLLKTVTSDVIAARLLRENMIYFLAQFKTHMICNSKPAFEKGSMLALARRIINIVFEAYFWDPNNCKNRLVKQIIRNVKDRQRTTGMKLLYKLDDLKSDFLRWKRLAFDYFLPSLKQVRLVGLVVPECVKRDTDDYLKDNEEIAVFLERYVKYSKACTVPVKDIKAAFDCWTEEFGQNRPISLNKLTKYLRDEQALIFDRKGTTIMKHKLIYSVTKEIVKK